MVCEERRDDKEVVNVSEEKDVVVATEEKDMMIAPEDKDMVITPEDNDMVNATAMEQIMNMDTVMVGSHIAAMYGRRWYIGRVDK